MDYQVKSNITPDRKLTQSILYFQFTHMGWTKEEMLSQDDRYGSLPFGYVWAEKDNQIIGTINLLKREINWNGIPVKLGGLGGVCVHSNHRRQGIALKLLNEAMSLLKTQQLDIAFLTTDLTMLEGLYSKVGFKPLGRDYKATGISGSEYIDPEGMIAPLNNPELFEQVLKDKEIFDLEGQDW